MTLVTLIRPVKGSGLSESIGGNMAKWKQLIMSQLPADHSVVSFGEIFSKIVEDCRVEESTLDDALFMLLSAGDVILTKDLKLQRA